MSSAPQQFACPICQGLFLCEFPAGQPVTVQCPHCAQAVMVAPAEPTVPRSPGAQTPATAAKTDGGVLGGDKQSEKPTPAQPESDDSGEELAESAGSGTWWLKPFAAVLAMVALGIAFWAVNPFRGRDKDANVNEGKVGSDASPKLAAPPRRGSGLRDENWSDATRVAQRLGIYEVRVTRGEFGPVLGRDAANAIVPLADACLQISLQIRNTSQMAFDYQSWYGNSVKEGGTVTVDLTDDANHQYSLQAFSEGQKIRGFTAQALLEPGERLSDVLIFYVPSEVDHAQVKNLYLWLDGEAQGTDGAFQFRIPTSMITNW